MDPEERQAIVEGVAALTITLVEMELSEVEAQQQLMARLNQLEAFDAQLLLDAAVIVGASPQPLDKMPEDAAALAVPEAKDDRVAVVGRAWLERLAGSLAQTR